MAQVTIPSEGSGWTPPLLSRRDLMRLAVDGLAWFVGLFFAALARFDFALDRVDVVAVLGFAFAALLLQFLTGHFLHLYRGRYRYGSFDEVSGLAAAVVAVGVLLTTFDILAFQDRPVPASTPVVGSFIALILMFAARYVWRYRRELSYRPDEETATKVLVFGAGEAGTQVVQSMMRDRHSPYLPVGLLDDDVSLRNRRIMSVPVLGGRDALATAAELSGATTVVIAIARAEAALVRDLSGIASDVGLVVKVVPTVSEIMDGTLTSADIRDLNEEDLLGRHQITTDLDSIAGELSGKRVLVTGAGGSIGSELCRQLGRFNLDELIMLDRDESALHAVELSIHGRALLDDARTVLADIRDRERIREVFLRRRPQVVFHAAALKHLPMLEKSPAEALKTNVLGTQIVLEAATEAKVATFVNISTDKAANPISVLGYSKRIAERLTAQNALVASGTYISVRFGNVLGSRGSVLTSFASQIEAGGPVTVTDPDVTRYFMTVPEAVQLVIQASAIGGDGEALVLDMGEPVRIAEVARHLVAQSGTDAEIVFTGLRPGEKLHEDLFGDAEIERRTAHPLISHVTVPPISIRELDALQSAQGDDGLRRLLSSVCETPGSALRPLDLPVSL